MKVTCRITVKELVKIVLQNWAEIGGDEFLAALEDRNFSIVSDWKDRQLNDLKRFFDALEKSKDDSTDLANYFVTFNWWLPNGFSRCEREREIIIDCNGSEVVINEEQIAKFTF